MHPLDIAKHYFALSNDSNLDAITRLFFESSTYRAGNGDLFLGVTDIMTLQRQYHASFAKLAWRVAGVTETRPGIIHFEFDFEGTTHNGEQVRYAGLEDVIIFKDGIQHIHVQRLLSRCRIKGAKGLLSAALARAARSVA